MIERPDNQVIALERALVNAIEGKHTLINQLQAAAREIDRLTALLPPAEPAGEDGPSVS